MTEHDNTQTPQLNNIDRRTFMCLLSTAAASYPMSVLAEKRQQANNPDSATLQDPWLTLAAVQRHLFPSEADAPGAADINALQYLQTMMQTPDADAQQTRFIKQGVGWLNDIADKQKQAKFVALNEADREQILRTIEKSSAGERWLSAMLNNILEALLSDPVYGGNPNGIGWQWLEHQPGYPTPSTEKMYYKLASRNTFRRTRA